MTNIDSPICDKDITIYHIPDFKIGSTCNLKARLKRQNYTVDDCEVVEVIPAGAMRLRLVWETEQYYAERFGYEPENEGHWATFLRSHTENNFVGENHFRFGKSLSDTHKQKISEGVRSATHSRHRTANVFSVATKEPVATEVVLGRWCEGTSYSANKLQDTARGIRKQHKGLYAVYLD